MLTLVRVIAKKTITDAYHGQSNSEKEALTLPFPTFNAAFRTADALFPAVDAAFRTIAAVLPTIAAAFRTADAV